MAKTKQSSETTSAQTDMTIFESRLLNLLALRLVQGQSQGEQICLLAKAGFRPIEIAALLDTTANNVSVRLATSRKAKNK